jgi:uncharacterized OB-fold protein
LSAPIDLPAHNAPFSKGVPAGKLLLQRCGSCSYVPNYPRIACPNCFGPLGWFEASGTGTIRTYSVLQRTHSDEYAEHLPIVLVRVKLEEGGEMISTLVGADRLDAEIGATVQFAGSDGWSTLPQFRLAPGETNVG